MQGRIPPVNSSTADTNRPYRKWNLSRERERIAFENVVVVLMFLLSMKCSVYGTRPSVVWIVNEDASPIIGCYGEFAIRTRTIDGPVRDGIRFTQAFVTATACSASRSFMVSGMYQMTFGAHNQRSQPWLGEGGTSSL